jgi:hypothetical protein
MFTAETHEDKDIYTSSYEAFGQTSTAENTWEFEVRINDGLHTDPSTIGVTIVNDGFTVGGSPFNFFKADGCTAAAFRVNTSVRVEASKDVTVNVKSSNSNDTDVDVTVTPIMVVGGATDINGVMYQEATRQGYTPDSGAVVEWASTAAGRGANLRTSYATAKALTPGGNAISAYNPATVYWGPHPADVTDTSLTLDTNYVNVLALHPEEGGHRLHSDNDLHTGTDLKEFRPPRTLVYSTTAGTTTINQSAETIRALGFAVAQLSTDTSNVYSAYHVSSNDNLGSVYETMYFWHRNPYHIAGNRHPISFAKHVNGSWDHCISNAGGWLIGHDASHEGQFMAGMWDCTCGARCIVGDYPEGNEGTHKATRTHWERVEAIGRYDSGGSGDGTFSGCTLWACEIDHLCTMIDCLCGSSSIALGNKMSGMMVRVYGGEGCGGYTESSDYPGEMAGTAVDCHFDSNSLGGRGDEAGENGKLTGFVLRSSVRDNYHSHRIEGARIVDSFLESIANNGDCITLLDSNSEIHGSTLLCGGGTGVPINAASAKTVSASGNRYNNQSVAARGLGESVTNTASQDAVNIGFVSDGSTAADNLESFLNGTGHTDGVQLSAKQLKLYGSIDGEGALHAENTHAGGYGHFNKGGYMGLLNWGESEAGMENIGGSYGMYCSGVSAMYWDGSDYALYYVGSETSLYEEGVGATHMLRQVDSGATALFRGGGGGKTADDLSSEIATVDGNVDSILTDTGTTLPASIAGITGALNGEGSYTGTFTVDDGEGNGLEGAVVHARRGGVLKASGTTNADGEITDWVFGAYTYDLAVRLAGYQPNTDTITVSGDAWTKTVSLTAISITAPDAASLCTVQFRVKLADTAVSGAVCKAKLIGVNQASDGVILSNAESSDTTDSEGVAELQLVQKGSVVKGNGIHKIWVEIAGNPVASVETAIPNQSTILFEDLLC